MTYAGVGWMFAVATHFALNSLYKPYQTALGPSTKAFLIVGAVKNFILFCSLFI
jgi:hypothetical protein